MLELCIERLDLLLEGAESLLCESGGKVRRQGEAAR